MCCVMTHLPASVSSESIINANPKVCQLSSPSDVTIVPNAISTVANATGGDMYSTPESDSIVMTTTGVPALSI